MLETGKTMIIEIKGIGIPNKGAELMLVAIMQAFESAGLKASFVSDVYTPYEARARYGLYQKGVLKFRGVDFSFLFRMIPAVLRRRYGVVINNEIDVVLDASGFAYGEQWGVDKLMERLSREIVKLKQQGKKIILLPQAFGPFPSRKFKKEMAVVLDNADAIYARDRVSKSCLDGIKAGKARLFPDFTNLVKVGETGVTRDVCVIPNHKMISMGAEKNYQEMLVRLVGDLLKSGRTVSVLLHEGKKDKDIADFIVDTYKGQVELLQSDDPLEIKALIGSFSIVVSSRFHGLVSALSQNIPAVATGWSHKYRELMLDYGVESLMVSDGGGYDALWSRVELLLGASELEAHRRKIANSSEELKSQSMAMWKDVFSFLEKG
jgi:colanic acid/amylovoran biosynthesis protein